MTELYLCELWGYLETRMDLLGEPQPLIYHIRKMWARHFEHEYNQPNLFPPDRVQEVFGTHLMPTYWGNHHTKVTKEML